LAEINIKRYEAEPHRLGSCISPCQSIRLCSPLMRQSTVRLHLAALYSHDVGPISELKAFLHSPRFLLLHTCHHCQSLVNKIPTHQQKLLL
jgi:hypothetical protein